jgi:hypothetical protein
MLFKGIPIHFHRIYLTNGKHEFQTKKKTCMLNRHQKFSARNSFFPQFSNRFSGELYFGAVPANSAQVFCAPINRTKNQSNTGKMA